jgi:hypothetical protein
MVGAPVASRLGSVALDLEEEEAKLQLVIRSQNAPRPTVRMVLRRNQP